MTNLAEGNMGDMDSRIRRAIEQSAAAEAASLLARLRSTARADGVAVGDKGRLDAGHTAASLDASREPHKQTEAVSRPDGERPRTP